MHAAIVSVLYTNALSYDRFQKNYNRLYSVEAYVTYFNGDRYPKGYLSASLADVLKARAPEIESITRLTGREANFEYGGKSFTESGYYADENFFSVFTFPLMQNNGNVLADPKAIAISETMAMKFFGNVNCIGKIVQLKEGDKLQAFHVTAVFHKVPGQSTLQFEFVIPFERFLADNPWASETGSDANETWIVLKNNTDPKKFEAKIKNLIIKQESTLNQELMLFPLSDKLLYRYAGGQRVWGEMQTVVIVGAIGFAILLIACFNFINLSIRTPSQTKPHEAGIKKVFGSGKPAIVLQFLGETFIVTLVSLVSACMLVSMLVDGFNSMFHNDIRFNLLDIRMFIFMVSVTLFTVLAAGLLPAFYLASLQTLFMC
ncbi:MAG: ABC transporter permease [Bacteroidales bacterium]